MYAKQNASVLVDGMFIISDAGPVGSTYLAKNGIRLRHDVANAERSADLDQLAARHDDFSASGQRVQREPHGRSIVVDDDGRNLPRRQVAEQLLKKTAGMNISLPALPGRQVKLQIGIPL